MSKILFLVFFLSCSSTHQSVQQNAKKEQPYTSKSAVPFNLNTPDVTAVMNSQLYEISGLAFDGTANEFLCHNDEEGKVFYLDKNLKQARSIRWRSRGDYEAIEVKGDYIYSLKSNGNLFSYNKKTTKTERVKTALEAVQEAEGLCFDYQSNTSLLIACKGHPLERQGSLYTKCIYSYDVDKKEIDPIPFLSISQKQLTDFTSTKFGKEFKNKHKSKLKKFAPSAIAVDPLNGNYYISSARGSILIVLNKDKKIKELAFLNTTTNPQPEGLTFDSQGNLYIATEGKGGSGKVFQYLRQHL